MAPLVCLMIDATPPFCAPSRAVDGNLMVVPLPSFQLGAAVFRYRLKFAVVPEESERTAGVIAVEGSVTPGLSALIAGSFQVLMVPWKMPAITVAFSFRLLTSCRL